MKEECKRWRFLRKIFDGSFRVEIECENCFGWSEKFLEAVKTTDLWPIDDWKEYPSLPSDDPSPIFRSFIHAYNQTNIEISGGGTINGHGDFWWDRKTDKKYSPSVRKKAHVPNLVHLVGCSDVKIENIVLTNSPHYTIRPQYCDKVTDAKNTHIEPSKFAGYEWRGF